MGVVYPLYTEQKSQKFLPRNKNEPVFCRFFANIITILGESCSLHSKPKIFAPSEMNVCSRWLHQVIRRWPKQIFSQRTLRACPTPSEQQPSMEQTRAENRMWCERYRPCARL